MTKMIFLGREFREVGPVEFDRDATGAVVGYAPQARYAGASTSRLHRYGSGTFCKFRIRGLHSTSGVYVFLVDGGVVYVGKAVDLRKRFSMGYGNISPKNCFEGGQQTNCRVNQEVLQATTLGRAVQVLVHECQDQECFEARLIATLRPEWNRT